VIVWTWICLVLLSLICLPASGAVIVAYPQVESIYRDFLSGVSEGIRSADKDVVFIPISPTSSPEEVLKGAGKADPEGVIWLGGEGLRIGEKLRARLPMVFGMVYLSPEEHPKLSGVTLQTDPAPLLEFARAVLPNHTNLVYVHHARYERSYVKLLRQVTTRYHFNLSLHPVTSLTDSIRLHRRLFPTLDGKRDVLLVSADPRVMAKVFYQDVLVESWKRRIPLLSNFVEYSWAGVMIGVYPDPVAYGRQIADMLNNVIRMGEQWHPHVEYAGNPRFAFNARYSQRLGINLPDEWRRRVSRLLKW